MGVAPLFRTEHTDSLLLQTLDQASKAPFYRHRLPQLKQIDNEAWHSIPFTRKSDLRTAYPFGMLAVPRNELATYHESSGTSGEPTPSYLTEHDWDDIASRFNRNAISLNATDTVLIKTPYSMVTTAHQMHRAARLAGATVIPADNRSSNMTYTRVVRLLRDLDVTVAWCLPTEAILWEAAARLGGWDPKRDFPSLRGFVVAGESLSPARRKRLSEIWGGKKIFQDYGSTETGSLAGDCSEGQLHIWSDRLCYEVYNEESGFLGLNQVGQLVVTTLGRQAMPLIRYLLEDMVKISTAPCACGSSYPTIKVFGRAADAITLQGVTFYPQDLEEAVYSLPLAYGVLFWRARHGSDSLDIEIDAAPGCKDEAVHELTQLILLQLGIKAKVRVAPNLYPRAKLTQAAAFLKPRYVFHSQEDWHQSLNY